MHTSMLYALDSCITVDNVNDNNNERNNNWKGCTENADPSHRYNYSFKIICTITNKKLR